MSKIITMQGANMLLNSDFLLKEKYKKYREIIYKSLNNEIFMEDLTPEEATFIRENREDWITTSMSEWKLSKKLDVEKDYKGRPQKCQLCNTNLSKTVCRVFNTENDKVLYIGVDCLGNVVNINPGTFAVLTSDEYERQEEYRNKYPEAWKFINYFPSDDADFEVSIDIISRERSIRNRASRLLTMFKSGDRKYNELNKLTNEIRQLNRLIEKDVRDKNEENGLSRKLIQQMKIDSETKLGRIRTIVQEHNGFLTTEAAKLIKDSSFILTYLKNVNFKNNPDLTGLKNIDVERKGKYEGNFQYKDYEISFLFKSEDIIETFEYPLTDVTDFKVKKLMRRNIKIQPSSKVTAINFAYKFLEEKNLYEYKIDFEEFKRYINDREKSLASDEKNKVTWRKFNQLMRNNHILNVGNSEFILIKTKDFEKFACSTFISSFVNEYLELPNTWNKISKLNLFDKLYREFDSVN